MMSHGTFVRGWDIMCHNIHSQLERDIEDQVVAGLRDDLSTTIPSLLVFTQSVEGEVKMCCPFNHMPAL